MQVDRNYCDASALAELSILWTKNADAELCDEEKAVELMRRAMGFAGRITNGAQKLKAVGMIAKRLEAMPAIEQKEELFEMLLEVAKQIEDEYVRGRALFKEDHAVSTCREQVPWLRLVYRIVLNTGLPLRPPMCFGETLFFCAYSFACRFAATETTKIAEWLFSY